jgi:myosin V
VFNFFRQVIHETIINIYGIVVRQVQELIKQYIVPAILDHDEMERGRSHGKFEENL